MSGASREGRADDAGPGQGGGADDSADQRLGRLELVAAGLARAESAHEVAQIVLNQGLTSVGASGATLVVPEGDHLQVIAATGFTGAAVLRFARFPLAADLPLSLAARTREPVWVSDAVQRAERFPELADAGTGVRSTASLPLLLGRRLVGALGVAFPDDRELSAAERLFLMALADVCAPALHRLTSAPPEPRPSAGGERSETARLAEVLRLTPIARRATALLDQVSALAARLAGAGSAHICLVGDRHVVVGAPHHDPQRDDDPHSAACSHLATSGSPTVVTVAPGSPSSSAPLPLPAETRRFLGVPLRSVAGLVVGFLAVHDDAPRVWPSGLSHVLGELSSIVVTQLETLDSDGGGRGPAGPERVQNLALAVGGATSLPELAAMVSRQLPPLLGATTAQLGVMSSDRAGLDWPAGPWPDSARHQEELASRTAATTHDDREARGAIDLRGSQGPMSLRWLGDTDTTTGLLAVGWDDVTGMDPYGVLPEVGAILSQALARVLSQESVARARAAAAFLAEASAVLDSDLDVASTLQRITRLLVPAVADSALVRVLDEGGALRPVAYAHVDARSERLMERACRELPPEVTNLTWAQEVLREGRGQVRPQPEPEPAGTGNDDAERPFDPDLAATLAYDSAVCVPMVARGRARGTVVVRRLDGRTPFRADTDLEVLQDLGHRAGVAVDSAVMYSELRQAADELQTLLLPPTLPDLPGLELAGAYLPAQDLLEVGGDFYDAWVPGQHDPATPPLWFAIGDVCGRGAAAAGMTGLARHTLRAVSDFLHSPAEVLRRLNAAIIRAQQDDRFCTGIVGHCAPSPSGVSITLSVGGHPQPLIIRRGGSVESAGRPGPLVGLWPDADFRDATHHLAPGDLLLLFTDGVTEARGVDGWFGEDRLEALAAGCAGLPAQQVTELIRTEVLTYRSGLEDDVAVLVLSATGTGPAG